uniref:Uncharacterized protein n=1 Tax=Phytophthora ramorum TaxID=164328 RepID=H3GCU6_PHYRM
MTNYYKAHEKQVTAFPRYNELAAELRTSKQQVAALSRCNELLRAQLRTSKQQATALSEHSEQVRVELEEAKTKAMQHEEESSTLRTEIKALQNKVKTAAQEKQDLETQLVVSQRGLCSSASDEDTDESTDEDTDEDTDDYVVPPVDLPGSYRAQDLQGGELVGGRYVLFTNWGFKRQQQRMPHLRPIPERTDAGDRELPSSDETKEATPVKLLEVVSKPAELSAQTQERRVQKRASDEISDSDDMDHFLRQVRRRLDFCMAGDHESPASDGTNEATPATLMEVVSKPMEVLAQTQERRVQKRSSEEISSNADMDHFLRLIRRRLDSCLADAATR